MASKNVVTRDELIDLLNDPEAPEDKYQQLLRDTKSGKLILPTGFESVIQQLEDKYKDTVQDNNTLVDLQTLDVYDGTDLNQLEKISSDEEEEEEQNLSSNVENQSESDNHLGVSFIGVESDSEDQESIPEMRKSTGNRAVALPAQPSASSSSAYDAPRFYQTPVTSLVSYELPSSSKVYDGVFQTRCLIRLKEHLLNRSQLGIEIRSDIEKKIMKTIGIGAIPNPEVISMMPFIHFDDNGEYHVSILFDCPPNSPWRQFTRNLFGSELIKLQQEVYQLVRTNPNLSMFGNSTQAMIENSNRSPAMSQQSVVQHRSQIDNNQTAMRSKQVQKITIKSPNRRKINTVIKTVTRRDYITAGSTSDSMSTTTTGSDMNLAAENLYRSSLKKQPMRTLQLEMNGRSLPAKSSSGAKRGRPRKSLPALPAHFPTFELGSEISSRDNSTPNRDQSPDLCLSSGEDNNLEILSSSSKSRQPDPKRKSKTPVTSTPARVKPVKAVSSARAVPSTSTPARAIAAPAVRRTSASNGGKTQVEQVVVEVSLLAPKTTPAPKSTPAGYKATSSTSKSATTAPKTTPVVANGVASTSKSVTPAPKSTPAVTSGNKKAAPKVTSGKRSSEQVTNGVTASKKLKTSPVRASSRLLSTPISGQNDSGKSQLDKMTSVTDKSQHDKDKTPRKTKVSKSRTPPSSTRSLRPRKSLSSPKKLQNVEVTI